MTDSFADLWASSAPKQQQQTLGSASPAIQNKNTPYTNTQAAKKYDAFSILSNTSSSASLSASRTATPNRQPSPAVKPAAPAASSGGGIDAFASLGFGNAGNDARNMSIAERAKKAEQDRLNTQLKSASAARQNDGGAWAGLDMLGSTSTLTNKPAATSPAVDDDDDWGFGPITATPTASVAKTPVSSAKVDNDDWGLDDFVSPSSATRKQIHTPVEQPKPQQQQAKMGLWDLDDFTQPSSSATAAARNDTRTGANDDPDEDFDFGDREDGEDVDDTMGILGDLSRPVGSTRASVSPQPNRQETRRPASQSQSRTSSPPPHVIGAIVEMGFTPQQARIALAATDTGVDVQAALEVLLSQTSQGDSASPQPQRRPRDDSPPPPPRRPSAQNIRRAPPPPRGDIEGENGQQSQTKFQSDKLMAQASEIGQNVFSKANAFWNMGKEKVQKVYEEYSTEREREREREQDGRPRWMREAEESSGRDNDRPVRRAAAPQTRTKNGGVDDGWGVTPSGFQDDQDTDQVVLPRRPAPTKQATAPPPPQPEPEVDLFSPNSSGTGAYVSKFRHGRSKASSSATTSAAPTRQATQLPRPKRPQVSATSSQLATSEQHAARGATSLAAGSYGDAEGALTLAIDSLPQSHLALAPLYNDRALARLKNGDANGAIADATAVLSVLREDLGVVIDHEREYVITAWKRRAEANEAKEKWDEARKDWERVAGCSWATEKERGEGVRGVGRCRDALAPKPKPASKPVKPPVTRRGGPEPPSKATAEYKKATEAAEAEAEQRHVLKDSVDAKLIAWKGGKETNIRALLASLDTVLWPELAWETVGMKDLITDKQVKIKYMKAIGRVHPDKLNASNTKLEHRMIANGVFGALNEAWNSSQT